MFLLIVRVLKINRADSEAWANLLTHLQDWLRDRAVAAEGLSTAEALAAWLHEGGNAVLEPLVGEGSATTILEHLTNALNWQGYTANYFFDSAYNFMAQFA